MALPVFEEGKHHIGLGPLDQDDPYGFLIAGAYDRQLQSYGSPTDFGGERDLIGTPSLSRWTQDDFSGGAFRPTWGKDPAMFHSSYNMIPSQYDRTLRTMNPIFAYKHRNVGGATPMLTFASGGYMYAVFSNRIDRYSFEAGTWFLYDASSVFGGFKGAWFDGNWNQLWLAINGAIFRLSLPTLTVTAATASWVWPSQVPNPAGPLYQSGGFLYFSAGNAVWTVKVPDNPDGTIADADWTKVGRLGGKWQAAVGHFGQLHVLVADTDQRAKVVAVDPANGVLPVADFPYNFKGRCIESYAGRIYVGGSGNDFGGEDRYGELYEITGNSLRAVKTFRPEADATNTPIKVRQILSLNVHEGLLFFGEKGRSLMAYDVTTDAFYGAAQLQPIDGQREFSRLFSFREQLYAWVRHPGDQNQDGFYRVAAPGDSIEPYVGEVITSEFAPEPDRLKRFSEIKVLSRFAGVDVEYSLDGGGPGGDTFTEVADATEQRGDLFITSCDLSQIPASASIRFRIRAPRGQNTTGFTELIAFTMAFSFLDTGRWAWSFTVNGTVRTEDASGSESALIQNVHDIGTELRRYARDRVPLRFRDLDGVTHNVSLASFRESQPVVTPKIPGGEFGDGDAHEAYYTLTLLEV